MTIFLSVHLKQICVIWEHIFKSFFLDLREKVGMKEAFFSLSIKNNLDDKKDGVSSQETQIGLWGNHFPSKIPSSYLTVRPKLSLWAVQTDLTFSSFYTVPGNLFFFSLLSWSIKRTDTNCALQIHMPASFLEIARFYSFIPHYGKFPMFKANCWTKPATLWLVLSLGTNICLKSWTHMTASGPTSDIGNSFSILITPWFRAVILKFKGIQEKPPEGLVKHSLRGLTPVLLCQNL